MKHVRTFGFLATFVVGSGVVPVPSLQSTDFFGTAVAVAGEIKADGCLTVCSFNIQFLGNSTRRDDDALAAVLEDFDIVVVQELVAPPYPGVFPDGSRFRPDAEASEFFAAMQARGFAFLLSEEDTGTGERNHQNSSATEWWVVFYRPGRVYPAYDLPAGYLALDRSNHPDFERVPYAFPFRSNGGTVDFVLISVHLMPGASDRNADRRQQELAAIAAWIEDQETLEGDFIVLGDMNIEDAEELADALPAGFVSLNARCLPTNTNVRNPKPYDHVLINPVTTTEVDVEFGFQVVDLVEAMGPFWTSATQPYPGRPYDHNRFRLVYSDHHPVTFQLALPARDDD